MSESEEVQTQGCRGDRLCSEFFPRKNADLKKSFRTRPDRSARRCTVAVFYPNWRTSHHKKGRPRAATSHESRVGKTIYLYFRCSHATTRSRLKQITPSNTGLGKLLGYYPNILHEMLHRNAAQPRPGNLPSAPQAFQKPLRAQTQANGCTTSQLRQSQPGATTARKDQPEPWTQHTSD